jgi:heptosyltransferase-3
MHIKGDGVLIENVRNILLIQLGDIGDVVLSLPCIRTLRESYPDAGLIVAVRDKAKELIEGCDWVTDVLSIDKEKRRLHREIVYQKNFLQKLRQFEIDLAFDLRTGTRGAILARLSGAVQRIGFYEDGGGPFRNNLFTDLISPKVKYGQHLAEYYHGILESFGLQTNNIWPVYRVPPKKRQEVSALFAEEKISKDRPLVAVQPFSLWRYKDWSFKKYALVINSISSEFRAQVVITGSPAETDRALQLMKICPKDTVHNLVGKTSIGQLSAVLEACRLFVGGDSAGGHLSAAVGTPTVSIFGPASALAWAPRGVQHTVVQKDFPCVPCNRKGCDGNEISLCLEELTVEEVMMAVQRQWLKGDATDRYG